MRTNNHTSVLLSGGKHIIACLLLLITGMCLLIPSTATAQVQSTGSISGTVQDTNGAALPGAQVMVTNPATGLTREATTDDEGRYTVPVLPTGTYQVKFTQAGFSTAQVDNVVVEAAVPRTLDQVLQVGAVGETITITEGAALITAETATTARSISAEEIVQVPTSTRSFELDVRCE